MTTPIPDPPIQPVGAQWPQNMPPSGAFSPTIGSPPMCVRCHASAPGVLQPVETPITRKRRTNHIFHLLMGVFTLSIWWWTVWPIVTIAHNVGRPQTIGVDRFVVCRACGARQA